MSMLIGGLAAFVILGLAFVLWAVLLTIRTRPRERNAPQSYQEAVEAWRREQTENVDLRRRIRELMEENRGLRAQVRALDPEGDEDFEEGEPFLPARPARVDAESADTVRIQVPKNRTGRRGRLRLV